MYIKDIENMENIREYLTEHIDNKGHRRHSEQGTNDIEDTEDTEYIDDREKTEDRERT